MRTIPPWSLNLLKFLEGQCNSMYGKASTEKCRLLGLNCQQDYRTRGKKHAYACTQLMHYVF